MKNLKLAYFCDRNQIGDINSKFLLFSELDKLNIKVDYFTSEGGTCNFSRKWLENSNLNITWLNEWEIKYSPFLKRKLNRFYDGLIISSVDPKIQGKNTNRNRLISIFKKNGKKVIQICETLCTDHIFNNSVDKFFYPTLKFAESFVPKERLADVICTGIAISPDLKDNSILTKKDFYKKYNIDNNKKIIAFYPTRTDRIMCKELTSKKMYEFYKNLDNINELFKEKGFEIIAKLHRYEYYGRKVDLKRLKKCGFPKEMIEKKLKPHEFYFPNIKFIEEENFPELIKYSESSIAISTTLIFFHHIFEKPIFYLAKSLDDIIVPIELGNKINEKKSLNEYIFGEDLFELIGDNEKLTSFIIDQTINKKFKSFKDKHNNYHALTGSFDANNTKKTAKKIKNIF